jgi:hypothetical protein
MLKEIAFKTYFNKEILGDNAIYFKSKDDLDKILKLNKYSFLQEVNYQSKFEKKTSRT